MNHRASSKTGLFLIELILVILFFAVTGAIYVRIFVRAHTLSEDSENLTQSVLLAQNLAEIYYGTEDNILEHIAELYPEASVHYENAPYEGVQNELQRLAERSYASGTALIPFADDWSPVSDAGRASYAALFILTANPAASNAAAVAAAASPCAVAQIIIFDLRAQNGESPDLQNTLLQQTGSSSRPELDALLHQQNIKIIYQLNDLKKALPPSSP